VVASAPVFHLYGHTYALIAPLLSGAPVYHGGWHTLPSQMARAAVRTGARVMIAHPHQYRLLGRTDEAQAPDFGRLRIAVSAGAPLPAEIVRAIVSRYRFEMFNCYGSSEAGAVTLGPVRGSEPAGDVGTPLPGVVAEISGAGELLVRSDSLAAGYLSAGGLAPLPRTGGGYRTGDLAELADGRIRLRGRIATLINVAGKKVSPAEVEGVIAQHPAVRDVQVLAEQDPARGEVPVARVVAGPLTAAELLDWCRSRLAPSALPRRFDFCAELPRSATGKPILLARGEEHPTGGEPAWPPDPEGLSGHCSRHDD
jgi:acyl-coenzyme A synthetase/AMP-(fatty) acid ligase